jgi:hypothetical protein
MPFSCSSAAERALGNAAVERSGAGHAVLVERADGHAVGEGGARLAVGAEAAATAKAGPPSIDALQPMQLHSASCTCVYPSNLTQLGVLHAAFACVTQSNSHPCGAPLSHMYKICTYAYRINSCDRQGPSRACCPDSASVLASATTPEQLLWVCVILRHAESGTQCIEKRAMQSLPLSAFRQDGRTEG